MFRACAAIAFLALCVIGLRWSAGARDTLELEPFQRLFRDLDPALQRAYRNVQEGLIEAENARAASGEWPAPEALAAQGIPPFAADPIEKTPRAWTLYREGLSLEYRGTPSTNDAPELLVAILEPGPGGSERLDPNAPLDETHHRLADGTVLHVSTWYRPPGAPPTSGIVRQPFAAGFLQILMGAATAR